MPPDIYAVLGNPIAHSKSPRIHALFARQTGQDMVYSAILVERNGLADALDAFQAGGGKGLNITLPFKKEAWELMDERSARAEQARAVNTVSFREDGRRLGDNTDGIGLVRDLRNNLGIVLRGKRLLVLGAGGAVRGVLGPLIEEEPFQITIANRTPWRAVDLAGEYGKIGPVTGCGYDALTDQRFDILVNGTSASLSGEVPPLPDGLIAPGGHCYDMMYDEHLTPFLRWSAARGASMAADGLGMLVEQAAESFFLWRGVRPDTAPVIRALREDMGP
jgi:shikimate dehydrogenase